jgi:four helix bundle protein
MANSELPTTGHARGDELSERLFAFAGRVFKLVKALPKDPYSRHVGFQLFKASSSAGANYEEARGGESLDDFVHKLGADWKELKESRFWLRFIHETEMVKPHLVKPLRQESEELCKLFGSSIRTARKHCRQAH